ncbi:UDP-N-acetylmuramoylalanine--D-glutamate ligase [compost metagenome]
MAILTNISPDHLDRHGGMEGYVAAKQRIFQSQGPEALALVGVDEAWGQGIAADLRGQGGRVCTVSTLSVIPGPDAQRSEPGTQTAAPVAEVWVPGSAAPPRNDGMEASPGLLSLNGQPIADLSAARSLPGRHNAQNAAFAYAAARALGVSHDAAVEGLLTFPGLAHRMEAVGRLGAVRFINDSKGTNADAARQALASYPSVFWIAGGKAKEGGIDSLRDLFPHVAKAYLIGEAADAFSVTLMDTPHVVAHTMERAVELAAADAAKAGGEQVVLLSPACASFDQFPDFEVRGEAFRAAVLALGAQPEPAA